MGQKHSDFHSSFCSPSGKRSYTRWNIPIGLWCVLPVCLRHLHDQRSPRSSVRQASSPKTPPPFCSRTPTAIVRSHFRSPPSGNCLRIRNFPHSSFLPNLGCLFPPDLGLLPLDQAHCDPGHHFPCHSLYSPDYCRRKCDGFSPFLLAPCFFCFLFPEPCNGQALLGATGFKEGRTDLTPWPRLPHRRFPCYQFSGSCECLRVYPYSLPLYQQSRSPGIIPVSQNPLASHPASPLLDQPRLADHPQGTNA